MFVLQDSPRRRSAGNMAAAYTLDTLDADDDAFGDTIQDTLNLSDSAQLKEDAQFHEMARYVCRHLSALCHLQVNASLLLGRHAMLLPWGEALRDDPSNTAGELAWPDVGRFTLVTNLHLMHLLF